MMLMLAREVLTVTKYNLLMIRRHPGWILTMTLGPFFFLAPFVVFAWSILGVKGEHGARFAELAGYDNFVGYLVIPLIAINVSITVFSWVSQLIRSEQVAGTLERLLVSLNYPVSLLLGRSGAHAVFVLWFTLSTFFMSKLFLGFDLAIDVASATLVIVLHFLTLYGTAFAFTGVFLWIHDAFIVQTVVIRTVLALFSGATIPIALYPGPLQVVAKLVPFTWTFELARRALLRAEPLASMLPDLLVVVVFNLVIWVGGFVLFEAMMVRAKATGKLGLY